MRFVVILDAAETELREAATYYSKQAAGLGDVFIDDFERVLKLARDHPRLSAPYELGKWRLLFDRFPDGLIYRDQGPDTLEIVAVMHLPREPGYWRVRV